MSQFHCLECFCYGSRKPVRQCKTFFPEKCEPKATFSKDYRFLKKKKTADNKIRILSILVIQEKT